MSLLQIPCGQCRAHTLCLCQVGRGKRGCQSGSERTTQSWHDGLSHPPVWTKMDVYRVIRHPGDEDERAWWACEVRWQREPVEIASGPAPEVLRLGRTWLSASFRGRILLFLPWMVRLVGLHNRRVTADGSPGRTDDGRVVREFKLEPTAREV